MNEPRASILPESASNEIKITPPINLKLGGVDPLGMRQINLDYMDEVFPGLNNVARHIRPFTIVTWAWDRAHFLSKQTGKDRVQVELLFDFVDRIEILFTWSQFLLDPHADLPGRQVLEPIIKSAKWTFGGSAWKKRRKDRQNSTALRGPLNYGPGLKALGWLIPIENYSSVFVASTTTKDALAALSQCLGAHIDHQAFNKLGEIEVSRADVEAWAPLWSLESLTDAERNAANNLLTGSHAPAERREAYQLLREAIKFKGSIETPIIRQTMAGEPSKFHPSTSLQKRQSAWRKLQVRQLFRFTLEAVFSWMIDVLISGPKSSNNLTAAFLEGIAADEAKKSFSSARNAFNASGFGPIEMIENLSNILRDKKWDYFQSTIIQCLDLCLRYQSEEAGTADNNTAERQDRLPLNRALSEANSYNNRPLADFIQHMLEVWIIGQHVYWAVGRGLADARSNGKTILRLKITLEEAGWTLMPGASFSYPLPTQDRLETAISLAVEAGILDQ